MCDYKKRPFFYAYPIDDPSKFINRGSFISTNGDLVRVMTNDELEEWFWSMLKYTQNFTDSRIALHDWLKEKIKKEEE